MDAEKALELARVAYPNDENLRVAYMLGLNEGYEVYEEQMLKDAVEAEIHLVGFNNAIFIKEPRVEILDHYNVGDRVRIVILKAEG